jgi:hypothetical protein
MRASLLGTALAVALAAVALTGPAGIASGQAGGCRPWRAVPVPPADGTLQGISGTSSSDLWVVGQLLKPRILHWNGAWWHETPQEDPTNDGLFDVEAIAPDDAWAVGYQNSSIDPLAMHWDGQRWVVISTPSPGFTHYLYGLDAIASDDVWAVGSFTTDENLWPLALHWDGALWTQVRTVDPAPYSELFYGISAVSSDEVWAVGRQEVEPFTYQPLIARWDGAQWSVVEAASPPAGESAHLYEVSAISPTDAWAVGWYGDPFPDRPMIQHWDGTSWSFVQVPTYPGAATLLGIEAIATDDVWAVGGFATLEGGGRPITLHWDGTSWTEFPAPDPGDAGFLALSAVSTNQIWAAGSYFAGEEGEQPLTIRSRGVCP